MQEIQNKLVTVFSQETELEPVKDIIKGAGRDRPFACILRRYSVEISKMNIKLPSGQISKIGQQGSLD